MNEEKNYFHTGKCDVCGRDNINVAVCSSTTGPISFAYCESCLGNGYEPYDALVSMGLISSCMNNAYKTKILLPSLRFFNKTLQEFDADVMKADEDREKALEEYEKEHIDSSNEE